MNDMRMDRRERCEGCGLSCIEYCADVVKEEINREDKKMVNLTCLTRGYMDANSVATGELEDVIRIAQETYSLTGNEVKQLREYRGAIAGDYFLQIK